MVAEHEVTPSEDVDEAWHLHLIYTRSYWDGLCRTVLGRPLHHVPTRGGPQERARHAAQYLQTLETYREAFWRIAAERYLAARESEARESRRSRRISRKRATMRRRVPMLVGSACAAGFLGVANPLDFMGRSFSASTR